MALSNQSQPRRKVAIVPILIAGAIALFTYLNSEKFINPETGRAAHVALSEGQEAALGLQSYREVLSQSDVMQSGPEVDLVTGVARRLAAATGPAGQKFDWQVSVVRDNQANAFCLPGGKIVVYTGILPIAKTAAGLATVMGHEMAHATSRHGSQRVLQNKLSNTLMMGANASLALGDMEPRQKMAVMAALGAGAKFGVLLPFSRDHESEADEVGLMYMARAGFDPHEAVTFWERMSENPGGRQPPQFMSTHPAHGTRIQRLQELMPKAIAEFQKAGLGVEAEAPGKMR
jgi:metalloendopeptidase OMA1, mitochondrial